jgi:RNA-directed DNA polymerase
MQLSLFSKEKESDIALEDVFHAYFDCRENKRNKLAALEFEVDFEERVIRLWEEINSGSYKISPLDVFIVDKPVKREIFAAQFKDRIIHHLVINKLEPLFEKEFIYDSYSCRKGKGTHFGVKRISRFIRQCSQNYQRECWILKMDIEGFFMHIDKAILLEKLERLIRENYKQKDKEKIIWLCQKIVNNDPTKNCLRKSPKEKWIGFPKTKSLYYAPKNCGLPVGNYTNQVFANFYLNSLDHFLKHDLAIRYYGRYVDDLVLISDDKSKLKKNIPKIRSFLKDELKLTLHPRKIYFQHYTKGMKFLGVLIKPWRNYISPRVKNNFWETVQIINSKLEEGKLNKGEKERVLSQINSYLGAASHANTFRLRKKLLSRLNWRFWRYFMVWNFKIQFYLKIAKSYREAIFLREETG